MPCRVDVPSDTNALIVAANAITRLPIARPAPDKAVPPIRTKARSTTILPNFIGLKFQIYNGMVYHEVTITEDMVGHKLGEFPPYVQPGGMPPPPPLFFCPSLSSTW